MKFLIKDKIYIKDPTDTFTIYCKERFKYIVNEKEYKTYNEEKNILILPRGTLYLVENSFKKDFETIKNEYHFKKPKFNLYPFQQKAVNEVLKHEYGILQSPCGSGKTLMAISIIYNLKQTSLILVDELKIQKQWVTEINKFMKGTQIGLIGGGEFILAPITIATVQTLRNIDQNKWDKINNYFGLLLIEECHTSSAPTVFEIINKMKSHYRFGITATPKRRDNLEFFFFDVIGPILYKVDEKDLDRVPIVISLIFTKIFFSIRFPTSTNWKWWKNFMTKKLMESKKRNDLIVSTIMNHRDGLHLVLSERVNHCKDLVQALKLLGVKAELLIGEVDSITRENLRKDNKVEVIVGTKVADKALDIPRIKYIHLTMPTTNKPKLEQRIGRGTRQFKNKKECIIFDYIDSGIKDKNKRIDYFYASFKSRLSFYKKKRYFFKGVKK